VLYNVTLSKFDVQNASLVYGVNVAESIVPPIDLQFSLGETKLQIV